VLNRKRESAN